jgi:hypothetical protein
MFPTPASDPLLSLPDSAAAHMRPGMHASTSEGGAPAGAKAAAGYPHPQSTSPSAAATFSLPPLRVDTGDSSIWAAAEAANVPSPKTDPSSWTPKALATPDARAMQQPPPGALLSWPPTQLPATAQQAQSLQQQQQQQQYFPISDPSGSAIYWIPVQSLAQSSQSFVSSFGVQATQPALQAPQQQPLPPPQVIQCAPPPPPPPLQHAPQQFQQLVQIPAPGQPYQLLPQQPSYAPPQSYYAPMVGGSYPSVAQPQQQVAFVLQQPTHQTLPVTQQQQLLPSGQDTGPKQLIVNFLDSQITNAELEEAFRRIGPVNAARVIYDKSSGRSKGFGFVYYQSSRDAATAAQVMTGQQLRGRRVKVSYANPQRPTPPPEQ